MTKTIKTNTVPFSDIVAFAKEKMHYKSISRPVVSYEENYKGYYDPSRQAVLLDFTLYGDYIGSTIEKSNYCVLKDKLKELYRDRLNKDPQYLDHWAFTSEEFDDNFHIFELDHYDRYTPGHSTEAIAICGDLPQQDWDYIKQCIEAVEDYPVLDEIHWSELQDEDCWESWTNWQFDEISSEVYNRYEIDLDDPKFEALCSDYSGDRYSWLWNIINDSNKVPQSDRFGTTEVNASAYLNLDTDDDELMEQIKTAIAIKYN